MMKKRPNQQGMTLLEVLVGFVIFSASLVAVLDYVGGQVYLYQLSGSQIQKSQLLYDLTSAPQLQQGNYRASADEFAGLSWEADVTEIDKLERRQGDLQLQQWEYLVSGRGGAPLNWSVIRLQ